MNFCSQCGSPITWQIPAGDNRHRHVCGVCETVFYQNPKIVAGCIANWEDKILLCRRAIEPRFGYWTLPAGFMENEETTLEAAIRETWEEARARVEVADLYTLFNLPHANQVYMMFRGSLCDLDFGPGPESLEVRLFGEEEIPWDAIAFPTIRETLKFYWADKRIGKFKLHMGDVVRAEGKVEFLERRGTASRELQVP